MSESLHEKYVPVLCFAQGERFYPMAVEDFVGYCTLRAKDTAAPAVEQGRVTLPMLGRAYRQKADLYLQSVPAAVADQNIVGRWNRDVQRALVEASYRVTNWQADLARTAYRWFSAKTKPATKMFWWNDLLMSAMGTSHKMPRLDLPPEIREAAIENYDKSQPSRPNYTYYHRTVREGDLFCLQYWFFYGYNDWATGFGGMNDHEGDWEGLYIFFEADSSGRLREPPAYVTYVGHHSRLTKPWGHPDITLDGTHPLAYVAAGSHAIYPERKEYDLIQIYGLVDYATGEGLQIGPGDWKHRVDLDAQPWTEPFLGAWGTRYWLAGTWADQILGRLRGESREIGLPGVSAPRGPRYGDDGSIRPNWIRAATWAGIFDLEE